MQNRAGWLRFLERPMTDLRAYDPICATARAADHNRGYFDHSRARQRCVPLRAGRAHSAIAGSKATVILDGSHSVKVIHPASSTGSCWILYRLSSHAGPTV
jgi:hypothetical protein